MKTWFRLSLLSGLLSFPELPAALPSVAPAEVEPKVPRFSIDYMDRSVEPGVDFYRFADGNWVKHNPVPPDKSRWGSFMELRERNSFLIQGILEAAATGSAPNNSPAQKVGDFYRSALDTNRLEKLGFEPISGDLERVAQVRSTAELVRLLAEFHNQGVHGMFGAAVGPDAKNSSIYAFELRQGGLALPDRDYYLKESFTTQRQAYREHVAKMFVLLGEEPAGAEAHAATVLELETELAKVSRSRVALRDPDLNYNKLSRADLIAQNPALVWKTYLGERGVAEIPYVIVGQPEFFDAANRLLRERPLADWKVYLRWQVLHRSAPFLHRPVETENFNFFGKTLSGQPEQEPRWRRAAQVLDGSIGEALGQLYVSQYFPPEAKVRMTELVENLKVVFREHLEHLRWMTEATRAKALVKFSRFTQKIGFPDKFRDYSALRIAGDDYLGNVRRAAAFEVHRQMVRVGQPVDRTEWHMTPPTVNAYFNPLQNEIVFPAGILQPPFFDLTIDDAVNYGAIGVVIGHEITHGYDDEGRKFDADGNLNTWWTDQDAKEFEARAQKVVDEYSGFEALPGLHVNGKLTLGENIADLGGVSIAYDALQRALAKDPARRKTIDGFTPEQRFFISFAQIWRTNTREAELRRLITVDPHSPGQFRAVGPLVNFAQFYEAFGIKAGAPMWRPPELRAEIW